MVVKRQCSFCAQEIEPGTGMMFVKRDGTVYHFCSSSCRKQQLHLGRVGHRFKWTRAHELKRAADRSSAASRSEPRAAPKGSAGAPARRPHPPTPPSEAPAPTPTTPTPIPAPAAEAAPAEKAETTSAVEPPAEPAETLAPAKAAAKARAKPRKKAAEPGPNE